MKKGEKKLFFRTKLRNGKLKNVQDVEKKKLPLIMMLMEDLLLSANKKKIISVYFRYSPKNLFAPPQKKLHF